MEFYSREIQIMRQSQSKLALDYVQSVGVTVTVTVGVKVFVGVIVGVTVAVTVLVGVVVKEEEVPVLGLAEVPAGELTDHA